jgi:peptidoglycan/LPS O-acetylase OafA/YrhL
MAHGGGGRRGDTSIGESLSTSPNSLNLVRLLLASLVIFSHSISLGGYGSENFLRWTTPGILAVYGFFGISDYLIAASATHNGWVRFLWHRVLRIVPAFWVCLVVTALVFGWIGWVHVGHGCGFSCYLREPHGPLGYIFRNSWLKSNQLTIRGTLTGAPIHNAWNGSLWTLFYEFLCYLVAGGLAVIGLLRRRGTIAALAGALWVTEVVITVVPAFNAHFNYLINFDLYKMLSLLPVFLVGSLLYLYRHEVPDSGWLALGCVAVMSVFFLAPVGNGYPGFSLTRADIVAPLLAYPVLWLGAHLPGGRIGSKNDYSYGIYIYAFPVAQLLALWGAYRWGYVPYTGITIVATLGLAVASWWLIEKRALSLKDLNLARGSRAPEDGRPPPLGPPAVSTRGAEPVNPARRHVARPEGGGRSNDDVVAPGRQPPA